jgi:uncharacterized protein (DUF1501 family)
LPQFVSIAPTAIAAELGGGFLGPVLAPFRIGRAGGTVSDLDVANLIPDPSIAAPHFQRRLDLLRQFEACQNMDTDQPVVSSLRNAAQKATALMTPTTAATFDLDAEPAHLRETYGGNQFGQGCLLARRLVERGVPCVEVTLDGWDTHRDNFSRTADLSRTLDQAFSALLEDLTQRGLLDSTLVVCQGEFGRTPKINRNAGRDHWPHAWSVVLAGGGISAGQVIGQTSNDGSEVTDRPVSIPDLIATVCRAVGIDPQKQNMSNVQRPIRIADPEGAPIAGVVS